ncbi:MAG: hypothetical protein ABW101_13950 [Candidatus Thiodiazotropha sp.]
MKNDYDSKYPNVPDDDRMFELGLMLATVDKGLMPARGSVRELEQIADFLHCVGEMKLSENIDERIINLLEAKITRKLMVQNRRNASSRGSRRVHLTQPKAYH